MTNSLLSWYCIIWTTKKCGLSKNRFMINHGEAHFAIFVAEGGIN